MVEATGTVGIFLSVGFPSLSKTNGASGASMRPIATTSASKKNFSGFQSTKVILLKSPQMSIPAEREVSYLGSWCLDSLILDTFMEQNKFF